MIMSFFNVDLSLPQLEGFEMSPRNAPEETDPSRMRVVQLPEPGGKYLLVVDRYTDDVNQNTTDWELLVKSLANCAGVLLFDNEVEIEKVSLG